LGFGTIIGGATQIHKGGDMEQFEEFPCIYTGTIYRRIVPVDSNIEVQEGVPLHGCSDEILGKYEFVFKGGIGQLMIKQLIEDLQSTLKEFEAAGIK
jgi:hypothetical protein